MYLQCVYTVFRVMVTKRVRGCVYSYALRTTHRPFSARKVQKALYCGDLVSKRPSIRELMGKTSRNKCYLREFCVCSVRVP
jgi:hypothetical protein